MGQYYYPTIINDDGTINYLVSHDYGNGLKLMEHSYIGNNFVNAVSSQIWKEPKGIAWIGDYSDYEMPEDEAELEPYEKKLPQPDFMNLYHTIFDDLNDDSPFGNQFKIKPEPIEMDLDFYDGFYIVNHTSKEYIDLGEYWRKYKRVWKNYDGTETEYAVHPLPLLTACGNGRGGGDYWDKYMNYDKVGIWAFDMIELTDEEPESYTKVDIGFVEE